VEKLSDTIRVKANTTLVKYFINMKLIVGGGLSRLLFKDFRILTDKLRMILKNQGIKGLVLFLKVNSIILQQSINGHVVPDLTTFGPRVSRSRGGLPRIIPARHRIIIRN